MKVISLASFLFILSTQIVSASESCPQSLEAAVDQQFNALDSRDLAAYMDVLPARKEQLMILPDGSRWTSRKEIEEGHREWFEDKTWLFKRKLLRKDVRDNWGVVTYQVSIERPNNPGRPFILSMILSSEENGCWYLQYDQNTLLPEEKKPVEPS